MNKLIIILFSGLVLLLSGCNIIVDSVFQVEAMGHKLYYLPVFDTLDTPSKISGWIQYHGIRYDSNDDAANWKNPEDMISSKKGSCADFAVLFLNIAHYGMKQDVEIICVKDSPRKIEAGGIDSNHAVCRFGSMIIEPQTGGQVNYNANYSYSFTEVFN